MGIFTRNRVSLHHHDSTLPLPLKNHTSLPLSSFTRTIIPSSCSLNPFLFNGHLQTFWTVFNRSETKIYYKRRLFTATDPRYTGSFAVDFVVPPNDGSPDPAFPPRTSAVSAEDEEGLLRSDDGRPMLVSLHGLTGGSHEEYLKQVLKLLQLEGSEDGRDKWEMCVINARGCGMSKIENGVLFNGRATWDLRQLVVWLRERFPNRPLFAVGYSLGANILINYLAEEEFSCLLSGAVVCSNPWDLQATNLALQRTWIGHEVYSRALGGNLKNLWNLHHDVLASHPRVSDKSVQKAKYIHEFDAAVQTKVFGYPTVGAYYRDASSIDSLLGVRVPTLCINAEDDPISAREALPWDESRANPYVVLCTTSSGGHLGWFEWGSGDRWFAKPAAAFLANMAEEVDVTELADLRIEGRKKQTNSNEPANSAGSRSDFDPTRRKMIFVNGL